MEKLVNWIVLSSKDSTKLSLMLKALAVFALAHFGMNYVTPDNLSQVWSTALSLAQQTVQWVSAGIALYGAWRKLYTMFKGTNAPINDPLV